MGPYLTLGLGCSLHVSLCKPQWGMRGHRATPLPWSLDSDFDSGPCTLRGSEQKRTGPHNGTGTACLPPSWIFGTALMTDQAGDA